MIRIVFAVLLLSLGSTFAWSAIEEREFDSPEQEERFKSLSEVLRCPKCLNTNLAGSDAPIANDLREEVYEQIRAGRSNEQIIEFMTARYGDFVMYRPPLRPGTYVLWFGPLLLLLLGFFIIFRNMRKSSDDEHSADELSPDENRKLQKLLSSHSDK